MHGGQGSWAKRAHWPCPGTVKPQPSLESDPSIFKDDDGGPSPVLGVHFPKPWEMGLLKPLLTAQLEAWRPRGEGMRGTG